VGKAITPPNALQAVPGQSQMPTAAAVAAAAATAKIQAMEAVSSTAAVLGLTKDTSSSGTGSSSIMSGIMPSSNVPTITPPQLVTPTLSSGTSGLSTSKLSTVPPPGIAIPGVGILPAASVSQGGSVSVPGIPPPSIAMPTAIGGIPVSNPYSSSPMPGQASAAAAAAAAIAVAANTAVKDDIIKKLTEQVEGENSSLSSQENMSIKGQSARHIVMQKLMRNETSPVIVLRNMVTPEEVDETLQDEITEECSRYGTVNRVIIYQEKQSEEEEAPAIVKIFVVFSDHSEAEAAKASLNGRFFAGRRVSCDIYDLALYRNDDLSG